MNLSLREAERRRGGEAERRTGGRADGRTGGRADGRTGGRADGHCFVNGVVLVLTTLNQHLRSLFAVRVVLCEIW